VAIPTIGRPWAGRIFWRMGTAAATAGAAGPSWTTGRMEQRSDDTRVTLKQVEDSAKQPLWSGTTLQSYVIKFEYGDTKEIRPLVATST
jgi:hypothetical protein